MSEKSVESAEIIEIAEGFYLRQAVDNIAWMDMGDGVLIVDALEQERLESEVIAAIRDTMGDRPVEYVLNTHPHYDHVALNNAFAEHFGAKVFNARIAEIPSGGRWFEGPERKVHMIPMGGTHTAEDCIVWVPDDHVLFTGDIFGWGLIPTSRPLKDAVVERIDQVYQRMIDLDPQTVIPGHGPTCTKAELQRWVTYFHDLIEQVPKLKEQGMDAAAIQDEIDPPADMKDWWRFTEWKHEDSVSKVIKSF